LHFVLDQLSHAKNGELAIGVEDRLLDVALFLLIIDWYALIKEYLLKGYFKDDVPQKERKCLTIKIKTIYILWRKII